MKKNGNVALSIILTLVLALGTLTLAACGGGGDATEGAETTEEQDNCYGDDMPVMNKQ